MTLSVDGKHPTAAQVVLPAVQVEPDLLEALEAVLQGGETVAAFIETSVRGEIQRRTFEADSCRRADASWREYELTGVSSPASTVFDEVERRIGQRRKELGG